MPKYHLPNGKVVHTEVEIPEDQLEEFLSSSFETEPTQEVKVTNPPIIANTQTPTKEAVVSKALKKGIYPQNKPGYDLNGNPVGSRPDSSMFGISDQGKQSWRNAGAKLMGEGPIATWLTEMPLTALDMFSAPESLLIPGMLKGIKRPNIPIPEPLPVPKQLPASTLTMPQGLNIPTRPSTISLNPPAEGFANVRGGPRGRFSREEIITQPGGGRLGVQTRQVYDAKGNVIKAPGINDPVKPRVRVDAEGKVINKTTGEEIPVINRESTPADYAMDIAYMKARGQEIPPEIQALADQPLTPNAPVLPQFTKVQKTQSKLDKAFGQMKRLAVEDKGTFDFKSMKDELSRLFSDESGTFDPYKLGKNLKKALGGTVDDQTVIGVRNAILQTVAKGGQVNVEQLLNQFKGKVTPEHLDAIVDDMLDSGHSFQSVEVLPEGTKISAIIPDKYRGKLAETLMLPRAIQSSWDLSYPFRQGLGLIHKKAWWGSWDEMVKALGSENTFRLQQDAIKARPLFKNIIDAEGRVVAKSYADRVGLQLTDLVNAREEQIASTWAESGGSIPYLSKGYRETVGKGVRASNRAYTAFSNQLRADTFEELVKGAEKLGLDPINNLSLGQDIANFVNSASGRGSIGSLEKHAELLNAAFFSPRLQASRIQMIKDGLNYKNYARAMAGDPRAKMMSREALKSVWSLVGTWTAIAGAAKMAGAEVNTDPSSSDFGKIKIGNTRLDPAGGLQQYLVLASRLGPVGGTTSSTSGKFTEFGSRYGATTRWDAASDFVMNKTSPWFSFAKAVLDANKDQPFAVADQTVRMFMPMLIQDMADVAAEDPSLIPFAIPVGLASGIGIGTQSYGEKTKGERRNPGMFGESDINFKGGSFFP